MFLAAKDIAITYRKHVSSKYSYEELYTWLVIQCVVSTSSGYQRFPKIIAS